MVVLYEKDAFLILVLSARKRYSSFLKQVFVFEKICFKVKVLKTFRIFTDSQIKTCRSLKRRAILKIPSTVFEKNLYSSCWLCNETSKKKRLPVLRQKHTLFYRETCWKEQPFIFTVCLINHIFQTSVLFNTW